MRDIETYFKYVNIFSNKNNDHYILTEEATKIYLQVHKRCFKIQNRRMGNLLYETIP